MPPVMAIFVSCDDAGSSACTSRMMSAPFSRCTARTTERLTYGRAPRLGSWREHGVHARRRRRDRSRRGRPRHLLEDRLGDAVEHRVQIEPAPPSFLATLYSAARARIALELALRPRAAPTSSRLAMISCLLARRRPRSDAAAGRSPAAADRRAGARRRRRARSRACRRRARSRCRRGARASRWST